MHRPSLRSSFVTLFSVISRDRSYRTTSNNMSNKNVIDSHVHIWATADEANSHYPYASPHETPPALLQNIASPTALLEQMSNAGVDGALIVQPIHHKFDHSYVTHAMKQYPDKFKGMLLHDPSLSPEMAVERLEQLVLSGYVGVRYNPYLWPDGQLMSSPGGSGLSVYKRCGELNVPVGIMCFKGLKLHLDDIIKLISESPNTIMILDHFGFCGLNEEGEEAFQQLLSLAKYPSVLVKLSALFRISGESDMYPYSVIKSERFDPLLEKFGSNRLMMGSDFPYVIDTHSGYKGAVEAIKFWTCDIETQNAIMGGNAERVFGKWR